MPSKPRLPRRTPKSSSPKAGGWPKRSTRPESLAPTRIIAIQKNVSAGWIELVVSPEAKAVVAQSEKTKMIAATINNRRDHNFLICICIGIDNGIKNTRGTKKALVVYSTLNPRSYHKDAACFSHICVLVGRQQV